ncbi:MAG: chromosome segregation protein SMC [Oscillospiraceae bacterium]|nr:chromosome segregation protein SMC [Oscillospiraceae bacterium]
MRLRSIELTGFKSFPDKTLLLFDKPVTVIVGPNGSGKSNIADAVMWVTGEQSTKALRGGKMEDVIFGGTQKRPQTGFAEVSLTLDNLDGAMAVEHTEVVLTRRYYRSGESEYYLNRKQARLRDISELLMDTGLGREGYSVIGQGKIDEILSVRSSERRDVFEEAVGISRYRHRREEAERKLSGAQENLLRIGDKISELELTLGPLREQAEKAKRFLLLRDELRALEVSLWALGLINLREELAKSETDIKTAEEAAARAAATSERVYADIEELEDARRRGDTLAESARADAAETEKRASELTAELSAVAARIETNASRMRDLQGELTQQSEREEAVLRQISEREERIAAARAEREGAEREISRLDTELSELLSAARKEELKRAEIADAERELTNRLAETRARVSALGGQAQELLDGETAALAEGAAIAEALEKLSGELDALTKEATAAADSAAELQNAMRGYEMRVTSRREKYAAAAERASALSNELGAARSREHMLADMERDYEGYSKAVRLVMQEASRGALQNIFGAAGSLIKTDARYALAIETALGAGVQSIIVASEDDGKAAINMLKRRDGGRATFLPVSTIRGSELSERGLEDEPGFVGSALRLSEFDGRFRDVFASLLGRAAVTETLDDAIRISRKYGARFKIVTLDGQVINAGGSMTGGSAARGSGIVSRAGELTRLRERIAETERSHTAAEAERTERERELRAAEFELESARAAKLSADDAAMRLNNELQAQIRLRDERQAARSEAVERAAGLRARAERNAEETEKGRDETAALEEELREVGRKLEAVSNERSRFDTERERINALISELRANIAAIDAETEAAERAVRELGDIRLGFLGEREARLETSETLARRNEELRDELRRGEARLAELRAEAEAHKERESAATAERLKLETKRTELDRRAREASRETMELERERSRLEQIKTNKEAEEKRIIDRLWDAYELTRGDALAMRRELEDVPASNRRTGELRSEIAALGEPNIGAIEEYDRLNARYEFLEEQRRDVENAKRELDAIIEDITAQMREIFSRGFAEIEASFSETFAELFGGGTATLRLDDPEDVLESGIEIAVQPPGKALKTLTLLSGGERAFAAIALYFAILKIRPAPFVVLDEIEAALDDANVARFAAYMRKMSAKTQMVVISHRRGTMEEADVLYGVTMQERGVSRIIVLDLAEAERNAAAARAV